MISARKGEFETGYERGGQTREHAMLVKTAGVRKLIVVINKMDDPTVQWSEDRWVLSQVKKGVGGCLEIFKVYGYIINFTLFQPLYYASEQNRQGFR